MKKLKNKGFSMIELLAVVVILGIIGTIGVAGVTRLIKSAQQRHNLAQAKVFISSAQTFFSDNKSKLPTKTLTTKQVSLKELVDSNYIEKLVDYNKKEYDLEKSYAFVTRMGVGFYAYDGELLTEDGERTKYKPQTNDDSTVTFKMDSKLLSKSNTRYTNKKTNQVEIQINDKDRVAVYRVSMYRQDKRLKELEYKEVGETSITTEIQLQTKDYPDGIYHLRVDVYDIYNNKKTFTSGNIVIDTLPPECSLKVSGTKGNGWDNGNPLQIGWYKEKNVMLALSITEKNEDSYSLKTTKDKNYIAYKNDKNNTKVFNKEQSDTNGLTYYAYAKDKAGNETKCGEVTLKIDTKPPKCNNSGGNTKWTNQAVTLIGKCSETGGSGCATDARNEYKSDFNSDKESPGSVSDNAGNVTVCASDQPVHIDMTPPQCVPEGGSTTWTSNDRSINYACKDQGSGCDPNYSGKREIYSTTTTTANLDYTVKDNAGNTKSCKDPDVLANVYVDKSVPKVEVTGNQARNWYSASIKGNFKMTVKVTGVGPSGASLRGKWNYDDSWTGVLKSGTTDFTYITDDFGDKQHSSDVVTASLSKHKDIRSYQAISGAGAKSNEAKETVKIDNKAASIRMVTITPSAGITFSVDSCNDGSGDCAVQYATNGKWGVELYAEDNRSGLKTWGAIAKYSNGGVCHWDNGTNYKWSGQAVCTTIGKGDIKRCYRVKDNAGNISDRVCSCQRANTTGGIKSLNKVADPSSCF